VRPQRVTRDIGHLPFTGQAGGQRVTAARCGQLTGQDAVVSLMRGDRLNGGADLS
jgi:hypothetical protein